VAFALIWSREETSIKWGIGLADEDCVGSKLGTLWLLATRYLSLDQAHAAVLRDLSRFAHAKASFSVPALFTLKRLFVLLVEATMYTVTSLLSAWISYSIQITHMKSQCGNIFSGSRKYLVHCRKEAIAVFGRCSAHMTIVLVTSPQWTQIVSCSTHILSRLVVFCGCGRCFWRCWCVCLCDSVCSGWLQMRRWADEVEFNLDWTWVKYRSLCQQHANHSEVRGKFGNGNIFLYWFQDSCKWPRPLTKISA